MIIDLTTPSITRLANEINDSRDPIFKLGKKEAESLALGIRTLLTIVGQPNLLYEMTISSDHEQEKRVTFNLPDKRHSHVHLTSQINSDSFNTTAVFTNTRDDLAIASLLARVTNDPESSEITSFTACIVTRETIPTDLPLIKRLYKKFMRSTGIQKFIQEVKQIPPTDTTYTTIHYPNQAGTFDIVTTIPGIGIVELPPALSLLNDIDGINLAEKLQEITSSLLQE